MSAEFFEQVIDAVIGLVPPELGTPSTRLSSVNAKVWFADDGGDGREHYEAQLHRDGTLEVGFHAEHRAQERNERVLDRLLAKERAWRKAVGAQAVAGEFVGLPGAWRRISEVGPGPKRLDVDSALDVAERLAAFVTALEPLRRAAASSPLG